ncbi:histone-like nucleoid-structuring protein Lsr2 [Actinophytocola sediminis]
MQKVQLFDDLENDQPAEETMPFAFDGEAYVIDLSAANAEAFRSAVAPYRAAARRLGKHKVSATAPARPARPAAAKAKSREVPAEWYKVASDDSAEVRAKKHEYRQRVREWANEHGRLRGKRGTIPREVYRAYEEWAITNGIEIGPASVGL